MESCCTEPPPLVLFGRGCGWPIAMSEELHLKLFWSSPFDGGMAEKKRLYLGEVKMSGEKGKHTAYTAMSEAFSVPSSRSVYQQQRVSVENTSGDTPPLSSLSTGPWSPRGRMPPPVMADDTNQRAIRVPVVSCRIASPSSGVRFR